MHGPGRGPEWAGPRPGRPALARPDRAKYGEGDLVALTADPAHEEIIVTETRARLSPEVHPDGRVTLALHAPDAKSVQVDSDFLLGQDQVAPIMATSWPPASRDADGWWSVTTEPMAPGMYRYKFMVDGFRTLDPQNGWMRKAAIGQPFNLLVIPGDGPQPWDIDPAIAHGTVVRELHQSAVLGAPRYLNVYLPPGYDASRTYPVIYLLHGGGNDYGHWVFDGTADLIMDTLIDRGVLPPTVVIMPDGNVLDQHRVPGATRLQFSEEFRAELLRVHPRYLIEDVLPFAESRYRVDGANRAIAGLSMGCMQAWNLLCTHPGEFTAAGLFSGTAEMDKLDAAGAAETLRGYRTVLVTVGDWDAPMLKDSMLAAPAALTERGIPNGLFTMPGGHVWSVWQQSLLEFAGALRASGWAG
jgi:enterochelin esterase family protein